MEDVKQLKDIYELTKSIAPELNQDELELICVNRFKKANDGRLPSTHVRDRAFVMRKN